MDKKQKAQLKRKLLNVVSTPATTTTTKQQQYGLLSSVLETVEESDVETEDENEHPFVATIVEPEITKLHFPFFNGIRLTNGLYEDYSKISSLGDQGGWSPIFLHHVKQLFNNEWKLFPKVTNDLLIITKKKSNIFVSFRFQTNSIKKYNPEECCIFVAFFYSMYMRDKKKIGCIMILGENKLYTMLNLDVNCTNFAVMFIRKHCLIKKLL
ncbi:hypothetical protein CCFV1_ORF080 [Cotesia congregata filamentous virus 1]|uniref:Uncharacterized protein n=1 Tax=Cotesia congregata filamentous virus 1 TaxID=3064291 RepID=A0ABC8QJR7_9VIRU|nr:hypothetical protein CCFV1_ORF080 [Cotesia congregata filamentous virus 1]